MNEMLNNYSSYAQPGQPTTPGYQNYSNYQNNPYQAYSNYPNGSAGYAAYQTYQPRVNQMPYQQPQPAPQATQPAGQNGKVVENEDIVKVTEVPFGSVGFFPKADLSEIYIKRWNENGTTSIVRYVPIIESQISEKNNQNDEILKKIASIEQKLDSLIVPVAKAEGAGGNNVF